MLPCYVAMGIIKEEKFRLIVEAIKVGLIIITKNWIKIQLWRTIIITVKYSIKK